MSIINTQKHPKLLWPGIKDIWGDYFYKHYPEQFSKIFDVETSEKAFEEFLGITGMGLAPEKGQGAPLIFDTEEQGYLQRYTHVAYALGYAVTKEENDDNLYEKVSRGRAMAVARSMRQTVETVDANHLNRAFNSSYTWADSKEMCATDHPNVNGGTWSNEPSSGLDLSEAAIEDLIIQIDTALDDSGLKANLKPVCLIVHPNDRFNARRILGSDLQNDTANNAINVLRTDNLFPKGLVVNNYLSDTDAWFIKTDCPMGLTHLWRTKPEFDKDNDFSTKNLLASGYMRFSSGITDSRGIYGSPGS